MSYEDDAPAIRHWDNYRIWLLRAMEALTPDCSDEELRTVQGIWKRIKHAAPAEALRIHKPTILLLKERIYTTDAWANYRKIRTVRFKQTERYKKNQEQYQERYQKAYYENVLKAKRNTPEAKDARNKRRRELYAAKKAAREDTHG